VEGLKDIKGLLVVEDYTLYIFIVLVIICLILLFLLVKKLMQYKRVPSLEKVAKKELKNIDLDDSKSSAYLISKYGYLFSEESFEYLEGYKYKKEVTNFSTEDLEKIKRFLDGI